MSEPSLPKKKLSVSGQKIREEPGISSNHGVSQGRLGCMHTTTQVSSSISKIKWHHRRGDYREIAEREMSRVQSSLSHNNT